MKKLFLLTSMLFGTSLAYADARLIIKYKSQAMQAGIQQAELIQPMSVSKLNIISSQLGAKVSLIRDLPSNAHVVRVSQQGTSSRQVAQMIKKLQQDPSVAYVVEDRLLHRTAIPNPNPQQWDMFGSSSQQGGTWYGDNFSEAWTLLDGMMPALTPGNGVTVAVLDTGYTPHPNFLANLQELGTQTGVYGYQFISDCRIAGSCPVSTPDSEAYLPPQANALDLGDYLTQQDINAANGFFDDCKPENYSSWHGSHVTGTIVATGSDSGPSGVIGGAYGAKVVPVRVLGKCGGYTSDILAGMMWAAGLYSTSTIPKNPNPAQVISMSLGGEGACNSAQQDVITQLTQAGVVVVAAAGNEASNVNNYNPASCNNVISVAANGPTQALAYYSNWGNTTITAAGGDISVAGCSSMSGPPQAYSCPSSVLSTIWGSQESYSSSDGGAYSTYQGTSMATPHVAAAVADIIGLLKSKNQSYTPQTIAQILQNSANYSYTNCYMGNCVTSGYMDVGNAINYVESGVMLLANPAELVFYVGGALSQTVTFTNNNSIPVSIAGTELSNTSVSEISSNSCNSEDNPVILNPGQACNVTVTWSGTINDSSLLKLTGTLNGKSIILATVGISSANPSSSTSSGGGGCSAVKNGDDASLLLILGLGSLMYGYRRYRLAYSRK